jgi:hypothetical protein
VAHRERLVVRAGECLSRAQFSDGGLHVGDGAVHPFELDVREALGDKPRTNVVVSEQGPVVTLGRLVELDSVVLDSRRLELLLDARPDSPGRLTDLELPSVRLVVNRVRVDPQPRFGTLGKQLLDWTISHRQDPSSGQSTR